MIASGDPESRFVVLKILKARDKFCQDLGWRNAFISNSFPLRLWMRVVAGIWSPSGGMGAMQDWPDQRWLKAILKLRVGTDVHDFKIDQYWPKHKGPGRSRKQLWEYSEKYRWGLKATGEVPYWLSIGDISQDRTWGRWRLMAAYLHKSVLSKFYPSFKVQSKLFFSWRLSCLPQCSGISHFQYLENPWELHT